MLVSFEISVKNKDRQKSDAEAYKHQTIIYKFQTSPCFLRTGNSFSALCE